MTDCTERHTPQPDNGLAGEGQKGMPSRLSMTDCTARHTPQPDNGPQRRNPGAVPDLRLAGFAVATWLAALACLYLSARSGLVLAATSLVAAVAAGTLAGRSRGGRGAVGMRAGRSRRALTI